MTLAVVLKVRRKSSLLQRKITAHFPKFLSTMTSFILKVHQTYIFSQGSRSFNLVVPSNLARFIAQKYKNKTAVKTKEHGKGPFVFFTN